MTTALIDKIKIFLSDDGRIIIYNRNNPPKDLGWNKNIRIISSIYFHAQDVDGNLLLINSKNLEITNLGQYEDFSINKER